MKLQKWITVLSAVVIVSAVTSVYFASRSTEQDAYHTLEVKEAPFQVTVPASASVQPENRIVVMPPVPGRIDQILLDEGTEVSEGQILAWMSSVDRAALIDAARAQDKDSQTEWEKVYRPTPILAPASGLIIARHIVPGQTVSQETNLFEISDRLIIRAQVDETDIGKIQVGQTAQVKVDAYPDQMFTTKVAKIGHQSVLINNVNMYEVLLSSDALPEVLRSGMTASVDFVLLEKDSTPVLPAWIASGQQNTEVELLVRDSSGSVIKKLVRIGFSNGENVEVLENLAARESVLYRPIKLKSGSSGGPLGLFGKKKEN